MSVLKNTAININAILIAVFSIFVVSLSFVILTPDSSQAKIPDGCSFGGNGRGDDVSITDDNLNKCLNNSASMAGGDPAAFIKSTNDCVNYLISTSETYKDNGAWRAACAQGIALCTQYIADRAACFDGERIGRKGFARAHNDNDKSEKWNGYGNISNADVRAARNNALTEGVIKEKCKTGSAVEIETCRSRIQGAFDYCYDTLGGNNNGTDLVVSDDELTKCISQETGIPESEISPSMDQASNSLTSNDENNSCRVEGVGWLVCPVTKFLANIADKAYDLVLQKLLVVEKLNVDTSNGGDDLYKAWEVMRNIANVAFVVAFLIIIYSQITGVGIGNYGIKRMLPRLIVAAILVNVSFWICAAAVDVSNILGATLKDAATGLGAEQAKGLQFDIKEGDFIAQGNGWSALAVAILAGATVIYLGLSILLPALIVVIMAVLTVVLVLTLRQALIILLIIISPLAFVAYLLPNTESLFKKWLNLFKTLLLMYPIISLIFGASSLASVLVMKNANGSMLISMMGACIAVIPLFITPVIMKTAGGLLNRFGGVINNPNKGPFDRLRKGADNVRKRQEGRRAIRAFTGGSVIGGGKYRRSARKDAINAGIEAERGRASQAYVADQVQKDDGFRNRVAGGTGLPSMGATEAAMQRSLAGATLAVDKATVEAVNAEKVLLKNNSQEALQAMSQGLADGNGKMPTQEQRIAAMQMTVDSADFKGINKLIDANSGPGATKEMQIALADALKNSKSRPGYVGQRAISEIRDGTAGNSEELMTKAINGGAYSAEAIATGDKDELSLVGNHAIHSTDGNLTLTGRQNFINNANTALTDPELSRKLGKNKATVEHIRTLDSSNEIRNHVNSSLV